MAQLQITRIGNEHFREYAVEQGDSLSSICLRFGQRDWLAVYNHPANAAFRARFPDPNQIDFVNPVNLFVPLAGAKTTGKRIRGKPLDDYYIIQIVGPTGLRKPNEKLWLRSPASPPSTSPVITAFTTDAQGEHIITNPTPGDWFIVSEKYWLRSLISTDPFPNPVDIDTWKKTGGKVEPTPNMKLTRNTVTTVEIHTGYYIVCPMCARTFFTVLPTSSAARNLCPNDSFDLSSIEGAIGSEQTSFASPTTGQDLSAPGVVCRGTQTRITTYDPVTIFWDESRFVELRGNDYTVWATTRTGAVSTAPIVGRNTWGAIAPITGGRVWEFHSTAKGAGPTYTSRSIPSNETNRLNTVMLWMTVHHTTDPALSNFDTARNLQVKHQNERGYADIGYHFIIDANGSIYEGRPLGIKGSHTESFNGGNIGIVLAGDFESRLANNYTPDIPTTAALNALDNLVDVLSARFGPKSVWSHRERKLQAKAGDTECPGANLIGHVHTVLRPLFPGPPP